MTDQIPMRSASERRDAAAKALARFRNPDDLAEMEIQDELVQALESLLEVPEVGTSEQDLVNEAMRWFNESFGYTIASIDGFGTAQHITAMLMHLVREAERAALEHWEPADVPSQEFMLRHLGIEALGPYPDPEGGEYLTIFEQRITKEVM